MQPNLVIYHGHCADGMGAAWAAYRHFGDNAEYRMGIYDEEFPTLDIFRMRKVYLVDFCYSAERVQQIASVASKVVILDHHKTAMNALSGVVLPINVAANFDLSKSGARITWDYFHTTEAPNLIRYIEDRDLWLWKLDDSEAINAFIGSFGFSLSEYDVLATELQSPNTFREAAHIGIYLVHKQDQMVEKICDKAYILLLKSSTGSKKVWFINTCSLISEVSNSLLLKEPTTDLVVGWFDMADKRIWSLRSANKVDCSEIAKRYGGGGHPNAAGFVTSKNCSLQELP